jgi:glycosyltransferase involved in cell wall biosynthesis
MEVLFDVTNLGLSFGTPLTRTGLFRATAGFAREVLGHPEVTARFAGLQSYVGEVQLARFIRSEGGLLAKGWTWAWENPAVSFEEAVALAERLLTGAPASLERRQLTARLGLLNRIARPRPLPEAVDVYHSLRPPLVDRVRVPSRVRVVTVYDMIPCLFPEVVEDWFVEQHRAVLASIDRDRDWVVCNSACTKADLCRITAMDPERVFVVPLAAAREVFRPERDRERIASVTARHGIPAGEYVLSLCTLEPRKNLVRLVRSFCALVESERLADLRLVLVGSVGWKAEALLAALADRPALRERVVLTGYVPDEDLSALYSGARAFVFPSLYEGFGLPVLEAMQCGVPVITSRASSLPEVVGTDAVLVDPTDEAALSQAMLDLLRSPAEAARLARRGLARARTFSWARTVAETVQAYRATLAAS